MCSIDEESLDHTEELSGFCVVQGTNCTPEIVEAYQKSLEHYEKMQSNSSDLHESWLIDYMEMHPQSKIVSDSNMAALSEIKTDEQLVEFADTAASEPLEFKTTLKDLQLDSSDNIDLSNFLQRPVLLRTISWVEGNVLASSYSPWYDFFNSAPIKKKLDNYYLLRCNLHLKFVINASPFYYGAAMVSYRPLSGQAGAITSFEPCPLNGGLGLTTQELMGRSQRPRVFLYPQTCQGAEMQLPFFYHKNWLNATEADDLVGMGTLNLDSLTVLDNANSIAGQTCTIQMYAWASDVELAGPTLKLALQAKKDEYGQGVISKPASAIARYANYLSKMPVIGEFATATSLAATTVSNIAHMFGYTNVPVVADVHTFKAQQFPRLATTDIGTPIEKLTLDSKNELSIDNKLCGIDLGDELTISNIVQRESYLETYFWTSANAPDTLLFCSQVTPDMMVANTVASRTYIQGTPMWMVNRMFQYWRGDITFRFKFICSQYHRGRVKISWDPIGDLGATAETTNVVYTKIVDITTENDVEFTVPYTQETSYLTTATNTNAVYSASTQTNDYGRSNGVLTMRVLTYQTSPVASADIYIAAFVKGAENLEFAGPKHLDFITRTYSPYTVQAKEVLYDTPTEYQMGFKPSKANENINLIHMGETVVSLRQVLRRFNYSRNATIVASGAAVNSLLMTTAKMSRLPLQYGWDPNGINLANKIIGVGTAPFNYVQLTMMDWVGQCFIANKGSVHWNINIYTADKNLNEAYLYRAYDTRTAASYTDFFSVSSTNTNRLCQEYRNLLKNFNGGVAGSNPQDQTCLSVSVPFYSKYKFASNNPLTRTLGTNLDESHAETIILNTVQYDSAPSIFDNLKLDYYCAIGTDFNFIFFLNVPGLQINVGPTAA